MFLADVRENELVLDLKDELEALERGKFEIAVRLVS